MRKYSAYTIYLILHGGVGLFMLLAHTSSMVYQVTVVGLNPLQLVLVGTVFEICIFLFEVPTGIVADVYSRRLSIIIGLVILGVGLMLTATPVFASILFGYAVAGVGQTFISGANSAWLTDEIGTEKAGEAFLRGEQIRQFTAIAGVLVSMLVGSIQLQFAILAGGAGSILLGLFLIRAMPETGFKPVPADERSNWQRMGQTTRAGLRLVRASPVLLSITVIALLHGMAHEGIGRLWIKYVLDTFTLPWGETIEPVVWVGAIGIGDSLLALGMLEWIRRRLDFKHVGQLLRAQMVCFVLIVASIVVFGLAKAFWLALAMFFVYGVMSRVLRPIRQAWVNHYLESEVRATVFSLLQQSNALGELSGGPALGMVGMLAPLRVVMLVAAGVMLPILGLYGRLLRQGQEPAGTSTD